MTADQIAAARECVRLCKLRPGEAVCEGVYEERQVALSQAWEYLEEALEEIESSRALADDLVEHLEHERALRRQDRKAAERLRCSHDELEAILDLVAEKFPETRELVEGEEGFEVSRQLTACQARIAELEARVSHNTMDARWEMDANWSNVSSITDGNV